ncbi:MAG: hypothetical protein AAFY34_00540 [Pseudomonadota bacterium]
MSLRPNMTKVAAAIAVTISLAACATSFEPVVHETPSGRPEATFAGKDVNDTKKLLINSNIDRGFILVESSQNVLEFKKPPERQRIHFYFDSFPQTRYPNLRVIYNVFPADTGTRTVASVWSVGSPGTINQYKISINDEPISLEVQRFLDDLAGTDDADTTQQTAALTPQ